MSVRYIHVAARVGTRPAFFPNDGHKESMIARCKSRCVSLMGMPGVVQASVFDAIVPAGHDLAVLVECESEAAVAAVEFHPAFVEMLHLLRVNARETRVAVTRDPQGIVPVDRYRWDSMLRLALRSLVRARWPALYRPA